MSPFDLNQELLDFSYRELEIPWEVIFPKLNRAKIRERFSVLQDANPHQTVFQASRALWNGGYDAIFKEYGFHDELASTFSGHCHQCTPALGLVLDSLGFSVSYLECQRVREHIAQTGRIEPVPPTEEPKPEQLEEFCRINRIPYCCLEVIIDGEPYYVTGKHLKPSGNQTLALLTPICYREFIGVFHHPDEFRQSGIYISPVLPRNNPDNIQFNKRIVWRKQTSTDPAPEFFATYLRMKMV